MPIMPTRAQPVGNLLGNPPIRPATLEWFKNLVESLDAPLGTGEGAFLFQARCSGQHNIGIAAGVAEKDILHDKEVELGECVSDIVGIGVDDALFLADQIKVFKLPLM